MEAHLKILYVNKVSPLTHGGAELRLREISRRLVSRGHEVRVVCGRNFPRMLKHQLVDGVDVRGVSVLPSWMFGFPKLSFFLARYLFYFLSLPAIFRAVREVDVVVDCVTPVASGAGIISKARGKPCVATIYEAYGREWFRLKGPVTATLGYLAERYFFAQTYDAYVTLSRQTADIIVDHGKPSERVHRLRHGVGVVRPSRSARPAEERLPEVVCVSRLTKQKNIASLLEAWKGVNAQFGGARLRVIGDGSERKSLQELAETLSISGSVSFEGYVTDERKWELLDRASAFVLPSLQEGFGIVLLEAMAAGLPIVAYDLPVFQGFLNDGEHGYLVAVNDTGQMAKRLLEFLRNDTLRCEVSRRNAGYAERFGWERAADQEEDVLLRLLAQRRGSSA